MKLRGNQCILSLGICYSAYFSMRAFYEIDIFDLGVLGVAAFLISMYFAIVFVSVQRGGELLQDRVIRLTLGCAILAWVTVEYSYDKDAFSENRLGLFAPLVVVFGLPIGIFEQSYRAYRGE